MSDVDVARLETELAGLREALLTRGYIGQALGILRERFTIDEAVAMAYLTRLASDHEVKVRVIAEELVRTGTVRAKHPSD